MRLDFNILWVDDQPQNIRGQIDAISRHFRAEGFDLKPNNVKSVEESLLNLRTEVLQDEVDLVLVDYELGSGPHGDVALREIRRKLKYRDIVFYSAKQSNDLKELAYQQRIEGVYCTSRDDLVDTVVGLFHTLVKKVLDIDHMRGIVMGATSAIDFVVQDCLLAIHATQDASGQIKLLDQARARIEEKVEEHRKNIAKSLVKEEFPTLLVDRAAFSADQKLSFLIRILAQGEYQHLEEIRKSLIEYQKGILRKRNILAHARLLPREEGFVFEGSEGIVTADEMKKIRCDLLGYRQFFSSLLDSLSLVRE